MGVSRPAQLGINHIGISVTDLERSVAFYCEMLGAEVVFPILDSLNFDGRRAVLSLDTQVLDINEFAANGGEAFDPSRTGLDHISFTVASEEDLERWAEWFDVNSIARSEIRDHNIDVPPVRWQVAMFDLVDPDGTST